MTAGHVKLIHTNYEDQHPLVGAHGEKPCQKIIRMTKGLYETKGDAGYHIIVKILLSWKLDTYVQCFLRRWKALGRAVGTWDLSY